MSAIVAGIVAVAIAAILLTSPVTTPKNQSMEVAGIIYPVGSMPYNLTYSDWAVEWWRWLLSFPKDITPTIDTTGESCDQQQNNPNVWFLAGTYGGSVERSCTIPSDKALFFPLINVACSYAYFPSLKTEEELLECALDEAGAVYQTRLLINGVEMGDLDKYLVTSSPFNVTLPENNVWEQPPNTETTAVTSGYYILLKPLPPGDHMIQYGGAAGDPTISGEENFATLVTLRVTVED